MTPSYNHAYIQAKLIAELSKFTKYSVFCELTLWFQEREFIPDIAIYSKRKIDPIRDILKVVEMPLCVIEILSPTQGTQEVLEKFSWYFQAAIGSCWLVLPVPKVVMVYYSMEQVVTFFQNDVIDKKLDIQIPIQVIFE